MATSQPLAITVERTDLLRVLTTVARVIQARNTMPILANVLLTATPDRLAVRGTDLDIQISASCPANCTPGIITVPAKTLLDIVKKLPDGSEIKLALEGETLTVKAGRSRFKLGTISADSFPDLGVEDFPEPIVVDISKLLSPVAFAVSANDHRYFLQGVYLHVSGGQLRAVGTDGNRLARHIGDNSSALFEPAIIPDRTVEILCGFAGEVSIQLTTTKIRVTSGDVEVLSKLIEGNYPEYERFIPQSNGKIAVLDRAALIASVDRVATMTNERSKAIKLSFASGLLTLIVNTPDGAADEEMAVTYDDEPFEIGYNADFLMSVLRASAGSDLTFAMADPISPTLITSEGPDTVLMPYRVA